MHQTSLGSSASIRDPSFANGQLFGTPQRQIGYPAASGPGIVGTPPRIHQPAHSHNHSHGLVSSCDAHVPSYLPEFTRVAPSRDPSTPEFHIQAGLTALGRADAATAETAFRRAMAIDPRGPAAAYFLANLLNSRGRFAEATGVLRKACANNPGLEALREALADSLFFDLRYAEALEEISKAIQVMPTSTSLHIKLAYALLKSKQPEAAMAELSKMEESAESNANFLLTKAETYNALGNFAAAAEAAAAASSRCGSIYADFELMRAKIGRGHLENSEGLVPKYRAMARFGALLFADPGLATPGLLVDSELPARTPAGLKAAIQQLEANALKSAFAPMGAKHSSILIAFDQYVNYILFLHNTLVGMNSKIILPDSFSYPSGLVKQTLAEDHSSYYASIALNTNVEFQPFIKALVKHYRSEKMPLPVERIFTILASSPLKERKIEQIIEYAAKGKTTQGGFYEAAAERLFQHNPALASEVSSPFKEMALIDFFIAAHRMEKHPGIFLDIYSTPLSPESQGLVPRASEPISPPAEPSTEDAPFILPRSSAQVDKAPTDVFITPAPDGGPVLKDSEPVEGASSSPSGGSLSSNALPVSATQPLKLPSTLNALNSSAVQPGRKFWVKVRNVDKHRLSDRVFMEVLSTPSHQQTFQPIGTSPPITISIESLFGPFFLTPQLLSQASTENQELRLVLKSADSLKSLWKGNISLNAVLAVPQSLCFKSFTLLGFKRYEVTCYVE